MKTILTIGGIETFISTVEHEFLNTHGNSFTTSGMSESDRYITSTLLSRGILRRTKSSQGRTVYSLNQNNSVINHAK